MQEEWRPVVGYEGLYIVSNFGEVKSVDRYVEYNRHGRNGSKKFLKGKDVPKFITRHGYVRVSLSKNGKHKLKSVHRLVALAFIPNVFNKKEINHINGHKDDNVVTNLEWVSSSENKRHGLINKLYKTEKPIYQIKNGEIIAEFRSAKEAERILGYSPQAIGKVALKKRKTAYGYQWEFKK